MCLDSLDRTNIVHYKLSLMVLQKVISVIEQHYKLSQKRNQSEISTYEQELNALFEAFQDIWDLNGK